MAPGLTFGGRLPEDIALYILEFLPAEDLLKWTQVGNRHVVNRLRNNDNIWKESLRNVSPKAPVPPPPKPEDMTNYEYAVLLFDKRCSACQEQPPFIHRFWEFRLIICSKCARLNSNLCTSRMENHDDLVPWICAHATNKCHKTPRAHYDYVVNKLKELEGYEPARSEFIASCRERTEAMYKLAGQLKTWKKECKDVRDANDSAQQEKKVERKKQVMELITEMGLGDEARLFQHKIRSHRAFRPGVPLDDKLLNQLYTKLSTLRDDHDTKQRRELLSKIIHQACIDKLHFTAPSAFFDEDLQYLPELFDLMHQPLRLDSAVSERMAQQAIVNLSASQSDSILNWFYSGRVQPACEAILSVIRQCSSGSVSRDSMVQYLELAVNVFIRDDLPVPSDVPAVHYPFIMYPEWRQHPFVFDAYTAANLTTLVKSCGLDPQTTPWVKMHNLNARFVCKTCTTRGASISAAATVFNWWAAVRHIIKHARGSGRVQAEDLNCVRISPILQAVLPVSTPCDLVCYRCTRCWRDDCKEVTFDTWRELYRHGMDYHQTAWNPACDRVDYTVLNTPPLSKIGKLLGTSSEVQIAGIQLLKDVAALVRGKEVEPARGCPVDLERIFGTEGLKQMNLFAQPA